MLFSNRLRQLREQNNLLQRHMSAALQIDTCLYNKIERGERRVKREQVIAIAKIFKVNLNDFLSLWLSDRIIELLKKEKRVGKKRIDCCTKIS
ncbi:MAG: helix-turn-helix transcriptional regulator [Paludibacteraceae bacterium]|jgi:transcriptional regulator with XRE-family HTH domain|nr:helix-turn-helix transcriptional regulator [Paludibacteraceae bacterium]